MRTNVSAAQLSLSDTRDRSENVVSRGSSVSATNGGETTIVGAVS